VNDPARRYIDLGRRVITELLDQEDAVVWNEAEAKLSDRRWPTLPPSVRRIDPHHLSQARKELTDENVLVSRVVSLLAVG